MHTLTTVTPAGAAARRVYYHDPRAPRAAAVVPSVFVAVHGAGGTLLLVQRCDTGVWELPGGRVDVGEDALQAACRETAEEAGLAVRITGLVGVYSDPGEVVRGTDGTVRQQFVLVFRGEAVVPSAPRPDGVETRAAAWVTPAGIDRLAVDPATRIRIGHAFAATGAPRLA